MLLNVFVTPYNQLANIRFADLPLEIIAHSLINGALIAESGGQKKALNFHL